MTSKGKGEGVNANVKNIHFIPKKRPKSNNSVVV